jgi:hypothetical protein
MMTQKLTFFLLLALHLSSFGQKWQGKVIDANTKAELPYANIGIKGKSIGGIANENGNFNIDIAKAAPTDSFVVSYLGYEAKYYLLNTLQLNVPYEIALTPQSVVLSEVVVYNKREKFVLGNNKKGRKYTGWGQNESGIGRLRGLIVEPADRPIKATEFMMHINENTFDEVKFRLNILRPNDRGEAPESLLNENVFFSTSVQNGWVRVNVEAYNIVISKPTIVAVEWVNAVGKPRAVGQSSHLLTISLTNKSGYFYIRESPQEPLNLAPSKRTPAMYFVGYGVAK